MKITGTLSEYPLSKLLQVLDWFHATGCLSLKVFGDTHQKKLLQKYNVWLHQGYIVLAQREDDQHNIYTLAVQKKWINPLVAQRLMKCPTQSMAAGLYLETQGLLNFNQLKSLFFTEVVDHVQALCDSKMHLTCEREKAWFLFQNKEDFPMKKMTGLRIPASYFVHEPHNIKKEVFKMIYQSTS